MALQQPPVPLRARLGQRQFQIARLERNACLSGHLESRAEEGVALQSTQCVELRGVSQQETPERGEARCLGLPQFLPVRLRSEVCPLRYELDCNSTISTAAEMVE